VVSKGLVQVEQNNVANICPICKQGNQCKMDEGNRCWCMTVKVPKQLIEQLPKEAQGTQCICKNCIEHKSATHSPSKST